MIRRNLLIAVGLQVVVFLCLATHSADAFDGTRKGFVLGGGIGYTVAAHWEGRSPVIAGVSETGWGVGSHVLIGYAWSEHNMIVAESNGALFFTSRQSSLEQGIVVVSWYHYFGETGRTPFVLLGAGLYGTNIRYIQWGTVRYFQADGNALGPGILVGAGYEIGPHAHLGIYLGYGLPSEAGVEYRCSHINVLISGIAF